MAALTWLRDLTIVQGLLTSTGLSDSSYATALDALQDLSADLPLPEPGTDPLAEYWLRPLPGYRLTAHPLPILMARSSAKDVWLELTRLGLDLAATREVPGVISRRTALRSFEQYSPTLFEFDVLAELVRAELKPLARKDTPDFVVTFDGLPVGIEARYKEAVVELAVLNRIFPKFALQSFGTYYIRFKKRVGGGSANIDSIVEALLRDTTALQGAAPGTTLERDEYQLSYDSRTNANSIGVSFRAAGRTLGDMLYSHTVTSISEKEERLREVGWATPALVALDLRSLVDGIPSLGSVISADPYYQHQVRVRRTLEGRAAVLSAIATRLQTTSIVRGVLAWWRRFPFGLTDRERLFQPWEVTLTTKDRHAVVVEPAALPVLMQELVSEFE
jgi:hypothetical protein